MTFRLNGTTINELKLNGTTIDKAYLNGTKVYEAFGTHELTVGNIDTQCGFYDGSFGSLSPTTAGLFTIGRIFSHTDGSFYFRTVNTKSVLYDITIEFQNGAVFSDRLSPGTVSLYEIGRDDIHTYLLSQIGNTVPIEITVTEV